MTKATALEILKLLPRKDCGRCGEKNCMEMALKLSCTERTLGECSNLSDTEKAKLESILLPKVAAIITGPKNRTITIGGEEVLYRHEYRFVNETKIFIDISDLMAEEEINKRIDFVRNFEVERIGEKLKVDGISIRCASSSPGKFKGLAEKIKKEYIGPIVLCSSNPKILEIGAKTFGKRKPIIYSANKDNWKTIQSIAEKYDATVVVYSSDLDELASTAKQISKKGFNKILFDPGVDAGAGLSDTINKLTILRKSAVSGNKEAGYPIICSTILEGKEKGDFAETMLACTLINRYASALIIHTIEPWAMLPVLTLRQSLYSDPRIEPMVESKLYTVGQPDKDSPVFLTSNFALTYYSVLGDLEKAKISCYLLPIDTSGLAVTVSVAADILTAGKIKEALERTKISEKVSHRKIIIPGFAARLKTSIEESTGWTVMVGPQDSSQIPDFLKASWTN